MWVPKLTKAEICLVVAMTLAVVIVVLVMLRVIYLKRNEERMIALARAEVFPDPPDYLAKNGMPKTQVEDLTMVPDFTSEEDVVCAICLETLDGSVTHGPCKHEMHTECLRAWLAKDPNSTCPTCRRSYLDLMDNESLSSSTPKTLV